MNKKIITSALMCLTLGVALTAPAMIRAEKTVQVAIPCTQNDASGACIKWGAIVKGCKGPCTAEVSYGDITQREIRQGGNVNAIIRLS